MEAIGDFVLLLEICGYLYLAFLAASAAASIFVAGLNIGAAVAYRAARRHATPDAGWFEYEPLDLSNFLVD